MVDTSDVDGLNPFEIIDAECARLVRHFEGLDEEGWQRDTLCEGWRNREMVAHLLGGEMYNRACLDNKVADLFARGAEAGANDMDGFNAWTISLHADKSARDVLDEWKRENAKVRQEFRALGPDASIATQVGSYPLNLQGFHIASEYATHADDMDAEVTADEKSSRLAWRKAVSLFGVKEVHGDDTVVRPGDGTNRVEAGGKTAELSDEDFVAAVTARLPKDHALEEDLRNALRSLA